MLFVELLSDGKAAVPADANATLPDDPPERMRAAIEDRRTGGRVGTINIANRGRTSDFSAGPFRVAAWYPATSNHPFGNGVQVSCATVGETFYFSLMHVVQLLSIASARRIMDRFLECLVGAAQAS